MNRRKWARLTLRAGWALAPVLDFVTNLNKMLTLAFWCLVAWGCWTGWQWMDEHDSPAKAKHFQHAMIDDDPRVVSCMKQYVPKWHEQQKDKPITPRQLSQMKSNCQAELAKNAAIVDQSQLIKDAIK